MFSIVGEDTAALDQVLPLAGIDFVLLHRAPGIAVAVDHATARNGHVLCAPGRQRRLAAQRIETFESGLHERVKRFVAAENDDGILFEMQLDIVFQHDGTGIPDAFGNDHATAAFRRQGGNGIGESRRIERIAVARTAEIGDADRVCRNRQAARPAASRRGGCRPEQRSPGRVRGILRSLPGPPPHKSSLV